MERRGKRTRQAPFVVKTPAPDPEVTARRLGMSARDSARVDKLIATARGLAAVPRSLLTYLRRQLRRVEKGETVPLAYPGLPLYIIVPVRDRPMIKLVKRTQRAPGAKKRAKTISWTVEELAQCLALLLPAEGEERERARARGPGVRRPPGTNAHGVVRGTEAGGPVQRSRGGRRPDGGGRGPGHRAGSPQRGPSTSSVGTDIMKWIDAELANDPKMAADVERRMREMERESDALERKERRKK